MIGLDDASEDVVGRRWESEGLSNLAPRAFDELSTGGLRPKIEPDGVIISPGIPLTHPRLQSLNPAVPVLGELELDLDCNTGTATYSSTEEGFGDGVLNLVRLTSIDQLACP